MIEKLAEGVPFHPKLFIALMRRYGHAKALDLRYLGHGEDWVELTLPYNEKLIGVPGLGLIASGPIVSLMDVATSSAIWTKLGSFRPQATLDLRVDYLRAAAAGRDVVGRGECYRIAREIAFVRGTAHDGDPDDPVANVTGTFMFTRG